MLGRVTEGELSDSLASDEIGIRLASLLAARDEAAWDLILRAYGARLEAHIQSKFPGQFGEEDREEIVVRTIETAWRRTAKRPYDPARASVFTYLAVIARSEAMNRLSRRKKNERNVVSSFPSLFAELWDQAAGQGIDCADAECHLDLIEALQLLSQEQYEAVRAYITAGGNESYSTTVEKRTGRAANTVRQDFRRACRKLREYLLARGHSIS